MTRLQLFFAACLLLVLLALTGFWLKSPYRFARPNQVAEQFVLLLQNGDFELAHEMTFKNELVGKSPLELKKVSALQLCSAEAKLERVSYSPLQTNGNRIHRWLRGTEIEMPEIHIEFENASCLFGVALRHTGNNQWKVFSFQSHAG
jgi:hypothetical protein